MSSSPHESRDENRPSTLVAFTVVGVGGGPALQATTRAIQAAVGLHQGRIVRAGDGAREPRVVDFRDAARAFAFSMEALRMAGRYNERHADAPLEVRVGIHHDTVWFIGEDLIGDALAVAVYLAIEAPPGTAHASAESLARLGNLSAWDVAERESVAVPGVEKRISVLEARPRPQAAAERPASEQESAEPRAEPRSDSRPQDGFASTRPSWAGIPLPPRPPSGRSAGQEIIAGLTEIGRAVVNELAERSKGITEEKVRQAIRSSKHPERHAWHQGGSEVAEEPHDVKLPVDALQQRKRAAAERAGKAIAGFVSHATTYLLVSGGLIALNATIATGHPWAYYAVGGWGIGLFCHLREVVNARRRARQLRALESVNEEQLSLVSKIQHVESSFGGHTAAYLAVNGYLAGINYIVSPHFLWFLFPAAAWGVGYLIHWTGYLTRKVGLVGRLRATGLSWRDIRAGRRVSGGHAALATPILVTPTMEHYDMVREARGIRDALLRQLREHEEVGQRMGADVTELLATYVEQLEKLVLRNDEFGKTLTSLPEAALEREIADYRAKVPSTEHAVLRREYEKAAEQGERQLRSVRELRHQKEILGVRIQSAFGLLKQLELDFVRLKNAPTSDDVQGIASIRSKSHEISDYLEGLNEVEGGSEGGS